jgi:nicotinate-nucleotide pyrophosphorylase (carboxylating)
LAEFVGNEDLQALIARARDEDLGPAGVDATSELLVPRGQKGRAVFLARKSGRLSGAALLPIVARAYGAALRVTPRLPDGAALAAGAVIAEIAGPLRAILAAERVALNFLTHLSGIATLTSRYVEAVEGTRAGIYDTRKTHAGLRGLEKYAVVCGGGRSHRMGLYDAVLVKDNHLAGRDLGELVGFLEGVIAAAARRRPRPKFVMVEVDTLVQLERVLVAGPDIILLDNMTADQLRDAVVMRDRLAPGVELEASGGVNLETVRAIAETGIDRISVGAITHSAPVLDVGLDVE